MSNTTKNHYIPQGYLKSFFNEHGEIWRYDKTTLQSKLFHSTKPIGFENNLYTIKTKITPQEVFLFKKIIQIKTSELDDNIIDNLVSFMNDDFKEFDGLKARSKKKQPTAEEQEALNFVNSELVQALSSDVDIVKNQEELCSMHENDFYLVRNAIVSSGSLDCLYPIPTRFENPKYFMYLKIKEICYKKITKKVSLYTHAKYNQNMGQNKSTQKLQTPYYDLFFYVIFQMFRSPKILQLFNTDIRAVRIKQTHNINMENIQFLWLQFNTIRLLSDWHADGMKPILIINKTNVPFVTSDHPVINIYGQLFDYRNIEDAFELYFPITSKFALIFSTRECYKEINQFEQVSAKDIYHWNELIFNSADKYVFSPNNQLFSY